MDNENQDSAKPMYTERRNRQSVGESRSLTFIFFLVLVIACSAGIGWLYFDQVQKADNLRSEVNSLKQSLSIVQEALQINDQSLEDRVEARNKRLKKIDFEIIKLWNLSNKKNKPAINKLVKQNSSNTKALNTLKGEQQQLSSELKNLTDTFAQQEKQQEEKHNETLAKVDKAIERIEATLQDVASNSENIKALKNTRSSVNARLVKLQKDVNLLRNKIISIENNLPVPSHNLETLAQ